MNRLAIFDRDGTLVDSQHHEHHIAARPADIIPLTKVFA